VVTLRNLAEPEEIDVDAPDFVEVIAVDDAIPYAAAIARPFLVEDGARGIHS
jgi:hypothetical protein